MAEKLVSKLCRECGDPFLVKPAHADKRFNCSRKCMAIAYYNKPFDPERLWSKVARGAPDECWLWQSQLSLKGYGQISIHRKPRTVTRVIWELLYGPLTPELYVLHRCDNPPCCNPVHLFLGTAADNTADMIQKGRQNNHPSLLRGENHPSYTNPSQWRRRLTREQKTDIIHCYKAGEETYKTLAARYNVSPRRIQNIMTQHRKSLSQQQHLFD